MHEESQDASECCSPSPDTLRAFDELVASPWIVTRRLKELEPSRDLKTFAFQAAAATASAWLCVTAPVQEPVEGGYRFVATRYHSLWRRFAALDPLVRHFYEVGGEVPSVALSQGGPRWWQRGSRLGCI